MEIVTKDSLCVKTCQVPVNHTMYHDKEMWHDQFEFINPQYLLPRRTLSHSLLGAQ